MRTPSPRELVARAVDDLDDREYDAELDRFLASAAGGGDWRAALSAIESRRNARALEASRAEWHRDALAAVRQTLETRRAARGMR